MLNILRNAEYFTKMFLLDGYHMFSVELAVYISLVRQPTPVPVMVPLWQQELEYPMKIRSLFSSILQVKLLWNACNPCLFYSPFIIIMDKNIKKWVNNWEKFLIDSNLYKYSIHFILFYYLILSLKQGEVWLSREDDFFQVCLWLVACMLNGIISLQLK